jgi:hypothetical protein
MEFIDWLLGGIFCWFGGCFILICVKFLNGKTPLDDHDPDDYAEWLDPNETRV